MNTSKVYMYVSLVAGGAVLGTLVTALGIASFAPEGNTPGTSSPSSQKKNDAIQVTDILSPGESNRKAFSGTIKSISGTEQIVVTSESNVDIPVNITPSTIVIERQRKTDQQFEKDRQAYNSGESDQPPSLYNTTSIDAENLKENNTVNIQTVDNIVGATEVEARRISVNIPAEEENNTEETSSEESNEDNSESDEGTEDGETSSENTTPDDENPEEETAN